ncbi:MAG: hypothetical protein EBZ48_12775 [Proteobacteria bacterium]|nr:hypothetical protein [Pseudomonadota bacterium]
MIKYSRIITLHDTWRAGSAFLFGPRQVGKSTLLRDSFPDCRVINLLKSEEYLSLANDPTRLRGIAQSGKITVIDEIQRIPELREEFWKNVEHTTYFP